MVPRQFEATYSNLNLWRRSEPNPWLATTTDTPWPHTAHAELKPPTHPPMVRRRSEATHSDLDLRLTTTHVSVSGFLSFSLSLSLSLSLLWWEGVKGVLKTLYLLCEGLINRVLDSRFLGGRHMEKMPHQTWSDHENRVIETRFIAQNRVFETQDVSKIYTFETVPTNYIVRKMGLIPNFGPQKILNFLFSRQPCSWGKNMKNNYYLNN